MNELILIADDALFARNMIAKILKRGGYQNLAEADRAEAILDKFKELSPELTLLDITLPDSKDLHVLKQMLEYNPEAKVIMVTAVGQEKVIQEAKKLGAKDFIIKPFKNDEFLAIVERVLKE